MMILGGIIGVLMTSSAFAAPPWIKGTYPKIDGNRLQVSCHGNGPDRATAFRSALNECRAIASETILQNFEVRSLTVQTERDSALHEEVRSDSRVTGLQCEVSQSYEETNERWLLCSFDTSKASVLDGNKISMEPDTSPETQSDYNYLVLSISPGCDSILIKSTVPRIIRCDKNPIMLVLRRGDTEIVLRSSKYLPKHITADQWQGKRVLTVYLDR